MRMKDDLIALINVIIILSASMAMTGCATTKPPAPLMEAAGQGNIDAVGMLIGQGVDVNQSGDCSGTFGSMKPLAMTPLACAVWEGHLDIVKLLLDRGANVGTKTSFQFSASGGLFSIKMRGPTMTVLSLAAFKGHADIVKILIEKSDDPDVAIEVSKADLRMMAMYGNSGAGGGIGLLESISKKRQLAMQSATTAPVKEVSTPVKSDIDELPLVKVKLNKNSHAIVIGIEQYRQQLPKADYAVADARTVTEYLIKVMGYPEENVVTLTNDRASLTDFIKYFEKWLPNNVDKNNSVLIYYSGHGAPNPKSGDAYLVPYDGDPSFLEETGYSLKRLYAALGKLPAKEVIVALDSCFSGAGGRSVLAEGARPLVVNMKESAVLPKNMTVLSASTGDQISSTYREKGHGLFTYFLLKGIKNEDVTRSDGSIKLDDLFSYIKPQVERIARKQYNNEQTPQLIEPKK